jgi:hypothetical protein
MGLPLLRLPLDFVACKFGYVGFSDRIFLVLLLVSAVLMVVFGWKRIEQRAQRKGPEWCSHIDAFAAALFCFSTPLFLLILAKPYRVYQELVAFSTLWAFLSFGVCLYSVGSSRAWCRSLAAFMCGYSILLRPTGVFYGFAGFAVLALSMYRSGRASSVKQYLSVVLLFSFGPILTLIFNYYRFGWPLEFGYSQNLTPSTEVMFYLRFSNPITGVGILPAAAELVSALFLVLNLGTVPRLFFLNDVPRWRKFFLPTYEPYHLILLLVLHVVVLACILRLCTGKGRKESPLFVLSATWALVSFWGLFAFYLYSPAITSRYMADFFPAVVVGICAIAFVLRSGLYDFWSRKNLPWPGLASVALVWIPLLSFNFCTFFNGRTIKPPKLQSSSEALARLERHQAHLARSWPEQLPSEYSCRGEENRNRIPTHGVGWDWKESCEVSISSQVYFTDTDCVSLFVEHAEGEPLREGDLQFVRAKLYLTELQRMSVSLEDSKAQLRFCLPEKSFVSQPKYQTLSLGWASPSEVELPAPLRLVKVVGMRK